MSTMGESVSTTDGLGSVGLSWTYHLALCPPTASSHLSDQLPEPNLAFGTVPGMRLLDIGFRTSGGFRMVDGDWGFILCDEAL